MATLLAARGESPDRALDERGAPAARREEEEYPSVFRRQVTQRTGPAAGHAKRSDFRHGLLGSGSAPDGFTWPGTDEAVAADLAASDPARRLRAIEPWGRPFGTQGADRAIAALVPLLEDPIFPIRIAAASRLARAGNPAALAAATRWLGSRDGNERSGGLLVLREAAGLSDEARAAVERASTDSDPEVRLKALDVLALHEPARSVPAIAAALDDEAAPVRLRAVALLEKAADGRAVLPLLGRLGDFDGQVRADAMRALGTLGDARAGPALLRMLADPADRIRGAAVVALGQLRVAAAVPALTQIARQRPPGDVARLAQLSLGRIGSVQAVAALANLLGEAPGSPPELLEALMQAGPAAVPRLIRELGATGDGSAAAMGTTPATASTIAAATVLGKIGDLRATRPLADLVERGTAARAAALAALADLRDPEALPTLALAATDPSAEIRMLAFEALTAIGDDRAVGVLPRGFADSDPSVRRRAVELAEALGFATSLPARLGDSDRDVRRAALRSLARIPVKGATGALLAAMSAFPAAYDADLGAALEGAAQPEDVGELAAAAERAEGQRRQAVLQGLAAALAASPAAAPPRVVDLFLRIVRGGGPASEVAADGLSVMTITPDRVPSLLRAFEESAPAARARLCRGLASARTPEAVDRLRRALEDAAEDESIRAAAAWAAADVIDHAPAANETSVALVRALQNAARAPFRALSANATRALASRTGRASSPRRSWAGVRLTSPDGAPLARRWARIHVAAEAPVWVLTGASGEARLYGLPPGPYRVEIDDGD